MSSDTVSIFKMSHFKNNVDKNIMGLIWIWRYDIIKHYMKIMLYLHNRDNQLIWKEWCISDPKPKSETQHFAATNVKSL